MTRNRLFKNTDFLLGAFLSPLSLYFFLFPKRVKLPLVPRNILVAKLCCFGDAILSLYALRALKQKYPETRLTILAGVRNGDIFERSGIVDRVITLPLSGRTGARELFKAFRVVAIFWRLWREKYDAFIDFDVYYRFTTVLGLLCGGKFSSGFSVGKTRALFYTHRASRLMNEAEWRCFFQLVAPLGILPDQTPASLTFRVDPDEQVAAEKWIAQAPVGRRKIGLVPGASPNWPENQWPILHFTQLMRDLNSQQPSAFFIVGEAAEKPLARALVDAANGIPVIDLTGKTPFPALSALALKMDLWVSNDTGPMHLAAALGRPTVGIFGPTNEKKWSPPGNFRSVFHEHCRCRPCNFLSQMADCNNQACLEKISPAEVSEAVRMLLEAAPL